MGTSNLIRKIRIKKELKDEDYEEVVITKKKKRKRKYSRKQDVKRIKS